MYAIFSTFAYLVNLLLASRFLPVSPKLSLTLSALALLVYSGCLGVNWAWQVANALHELPPASHMHLSSHETAPRTHRPPGVDAISTGSPRTPCTAEPHPHPTLTPTLTPNPTQLRYLHRLLFAQQGGVSLVHGSSIAIYLALISQVRANQPPLRPRPDGSPHNALLTPQTISSSQVVWDDCVLVRWLWKNVGKQWAVALEAQRERAATQRVPGKDKKL